MDFYNAGMFLVAGTRVYYRARREEPYDLVDEGRWDAAQRRPLVLMADPALAALCTEHAFIKHNQCTRKILSFRVLPQRARDSGAGWDSGKDAHVERIARTYALVTKCAPRLEDCAAAFAQSERMLIL